MHSPVRKGSSVSAISSKLPSIRNISTISNRLSSIKKRHLPDGFLSPVSFLKEQHDSQEEEQLHRTIQFTGFEPDVDLPPRPPRDPTKVPISLFSPKMHSPTNRTPTEHPLKKSMLLEMRKRLNNTEMKARIAIAGRQALTRQNKELKDYLNQEAFSEERKLRAKMKCSFKINDYTLFNKLKAFP